MQASQQVSLLAPHATPGSIPGAATGVRALAGVAQLVEHLFCKQVVSGSIPLASSAEDLASVSPQVSSVLLSENSEGCPSGQREQAVNLPARAYVGSNPTPSTNVCHGSSAPPRRSTRFVIPGGGEFGGSPPQVLGPRPQNSRRVSLALRGRRGMSRPRQGFDVALNFAGVTQLVESQFSKLKVDGSSPFSRSKFLGAPRTTFVTVPVTCTNTAHLAQLVEHVLGKDEVISSNLMVGSAKVQP